MKAKINFKKAGHFFEAGSNEQKTQEQVQEAVVKKARRVKIAKWTAIGVGATGLTILGIKGIKKLVGKKSQQQEVTAPEDQPEAAAEETAENKKPQGKKADK